ncbi:hypothetical protein [Pseudomonas aeruginosa]|uniref:hypothetical protein n=1 Tax=Pseudomonas aeruginosa TaxID=287 RepID=UPI0004456D24|nr:hypothetical protein [Pseudomonas aeruginosa]KAJ09055.1 hypothetical protein M003_17860 [Pseudomonas aeruginosa IGB83]
MASYIALVELENGGKLVPLLDDQGFMRAFADHREAQRAVDERAASVPDMPVRIVVDLNSWGVGLTI